MSDPLSRRNNSHKHFQNSFSILQWNCQGIRSKFTTLQSIAYKYEIICIQESILHDANHFYLKGFQIRKDINSQNKRGLCTLVRNDISFSHVDLDHITDP